MNYRDIVFKVLWTGIAAALGILVVVLPDIPAWWGVPATMAANAALAWVRQQLGETPATLEPATSLSLRKARG